MTFLIRILHLLFIVGCIIQLNIMNSKVLIAIIAAVIVVGAAAFVLTSGDDGKTDDKDFDEKSGALLIYGNANGDSCIDEKDVEMIEQLIESGTYLRIADANMDGTLDSDDVSVVKKLISHQSTEAYYLDMADGATKFDYPIKSFMGIHQFVLMPMVAIGAMQYMDGYTLSPSGMESASMLQSLFDSEINVNTSYNMVDVEKLASLPVKPQYIFCHHESLSNENKLEKSGIQIVHMDFGDFAGSVSAIRTAGFMLDLYDAAQDYVKFTEDVISDIQSKIIGKIGDSDRKTVMCGYMTNCIDKLDGTYTPLAVAAGAKAVLEDSDIDGQYVEFNRGDEWILAYNEDYFFYMNSWAYEGDADETAIYKKAADYFTTLKSYKAGNFVVFNSVMPPALTVAYMAEVLYPDLIGSDYGDRMNQEYIDKYFPDFAKTFKATDNTFVITYDMVKDSL